MNKRTEAKLTNLSGMQKAIEEILKQAWERGRKYEQNEARTQGEWEICQNNLFIRCSRCRQAEEVPTIGGFPLYDFCPNCGAYMRKVVKKNDETSESNSNS